MSRRLVEIEHYRNRTGKGYLGLFVRAYLPEAVIEACRRSGILGRRRMKTVYPWLRQPLYSRLGYPLGLAEEVIQAPKLGPVGKSVAGMALSLYNITRLAFNDGLAAFCGTEWRIPYADRRIVEFGMRLPVHLACSQGLGRIILRRSMRDTVPEPIRASRRSGHLTDLIKRGFEMEREAINSLMHGSVLEEIGMIDSQALSRRIQLHQSGTRPLSREIYSCLPTLYVENWLRHRN